MDRRGFDGDVTAGLDKLSVELLGLDSFTALELLGEPPATSVGHDGRHYVEVDIESRWITNAVIEEAGKA